MHKLRATQEQPEVQPSREDSPALEAPREGGVLPPRKDLDREAFECMSFEDFYGELFPR